MILRRIATIRILNSSIMKTITCIFGYLNNIIFYLLPSEVLSKFLQHIIKCKFLGFSKLQSSREILNLGKYTKNQVSLCLIQYKLHASVFKIRFEAKNKVNKRFFIHLTYFFERCLMHHPKIS